jgi:Immunity protein 35
MMTKAEAQIKADEYLKELQKGCPVDIAFNGEVTEEHPIGFVFFYNSTEFWRTRDFAKSLAGNGPLLVMRDSGKVCVLPSHQSVKRSLLELPPPPYSEHSTPRG